MTFSPCRSLALCSLALALLSTAPAAEASVPAAPVVAQVSQPDGTTISIMQKGTRQRNWYTTVDGYAIVQSNDGWWRYAQPSAGGALEATAMRVGLDDASARQQLSIGLVPGLDNGEPGDLHIPRRVRPPGRSGTVTQPVLTIIVSFQDISTIYSDASFQSLIYGATDSVKDYYDEISYGNFNIVPANETEGTANDGVVAVTLGINHPNPGSGGSAAIVSAAFAAADPYIDYSAYDDNGDGEISVGELSIMLIAAGWEAAFAPNSDPKVWGHKSAIADQTHDSVILSSYCIFGERQSSHQATIGIMVHELGHLMLGLPDLYDTDATNGDSEGIGRWGVMGSGSWLGSTYSGDTPGNMVGWAKAKVGFIAPSDVTAANDLVIQPADSSASYKRVWTDPYKLSTYFLLEARRASGYDSELPGTGLLIAHVDEQAGSNKDETHKMVDIEAADGNLDLDNEVNRGDDGDPYPGSSNNTAFNNTSNPNSKRYDGSASGVTIDDITSVAGGAMSVDISSTVAAGDHLRYDQGFGGLARGWGSNVLWTAGRFTNNTSMDLLDGVEVYFNPNDDSDFTIDLYVYESIPSGVPTNLLYQENGFDVVAGTVRLMLSTPQAFPAASDRVIVLRVEGDNAGTNTWGWHDATGAASSGRFYHDANGAGTFSSLAAYGDLLQRALLGQTAQNTLTVTRAGTGSGTVTSSPAGINCGADCDEDYTAGSSVTVTATANTGSSFAGWTGDAQCVTANAATTVTMSADVDCTATFNLEEHTLTIALGGTGGGSVSSSPSGINCPGDCSEAYDHGSSVTLTAAADGSSAFSSWSGACSGSNVQATVTMNAAASCTADFTATHNTLTVTRTGAGAGTVVSYPSGINCGADCTELYAAATVVVLDPIASSGSHFVGWSGDADCLDGQVSMSAAPTCSAQFSLDAVLDQGAVFYTSEANWSSRVRDIELFDTTGVNVALADEIAVSPAPSNTWLGDTLTFDSANTGLARSFEIKALEYLGYAAGWAWDDNELAPDDVLSPNDVNNGEDDDVEWTFTSGPDLYAFGFTVYDNSGAAAGVEAVRVYGASDELLGHLDLSLVTFTSNTFLGVITDTPILKVVFDEDPGADDVGIRDFRFADGRAATVLSQAFAGTTGFASDAGCDTCTASKKSLAENFTVTGSKAIGQVILTGGYTPSGVLPGFDDFDVIFRADAGGLPGVALATVAGIPATPRVGRPGAFDDEDSNTLGEYEVTLTLPDPVVLAAGTYWVEVFADTTGNGRDWSWATGTLAAPGIAGMADADGEAPGASWSAKAGDLAIRLVAARELPLLAVNKTGNGAGTVTSVPAGIDCGADCTENLVHGTAVTLTATPAVGSVWVGWGGDCSGTASSASVTVDQARTCSAEFDLTLHTLSVTTAGAGAGSVSSHPTGIDCGGDCSEDYPHGTLVTLTAVPAVGSAFAGWSGACSGSELSASVTLDQARSCTATFDVAQHTLSTVLAGNGGGSVASAPAGISCGSDCSEDYAHGAEVTLTATVDAGSSFNGWSGDCAGALLSSAVTMSEARSCTATFSLDQYTLTVTKGGAGSGSVTSGPAGIDCGADCSELFDYGTLVTLTAAPAVGSEITAWSGACSGSDTSAQVSVDQAKTCHVDFAVQVFQLTTSVTGSGSVASAPLGISCGADCSESYDYGTSVTLTATPAIGWDFAGWSGDCSGTAITDSVTMTEARSCTATFEIETHTLSVTKSGSGSGGVSSSPAGISCGVDCSEDYDYQTAVTLTASPAVGSDFVSWAGDCSGTEPSALVTVDQARSCNAAFTLEAYALDVTAVGNGSITSVPAGIDCGADCSEIYDYGTVVTLTANPAEGYELTGWSGACSGTNSTFVITVTEARSCTATFALKTHPLNVSTSGNGSGTVLSSPPGIACGADCNETYDHGTVVTLTATAAEGSDFSGWSGHCSGSNASAEVLIDEARSCTAEFTLERYPLTVSRTGSGSGSVSSSPAGISCGADCSEDFDYGTSVTLTAVPATGSDFTSWAGACAGGNASVAVTVDQARSCTATFTIESHQLSTVVVGNGSITSDPSGIDCGADCVETYDYGTSVTLTAVASAGHELSAWSGDCTGTDPSAVVTMSGARACTATFVPQQRTLSVTRVGTGSGTVASSPAGIDCGEVCSRDFDLGSQVTLTATPVVGSTFDGWAGSCSGTDASVQVTMSEARACLATFTLETYTLLATVVGSGSMTSSPVGIDCSPAGSPGADCSESYDYGTVVTLTATPSANHELLGWSGDCSGVSSVANVTLTEARACTATFALVRHAVSITVAGAGSVLSSPAGIDCGAQCTADFDHGTNLSLTATPEAGQLFVGWTGDCAGSSAMTSIEVGASRFCTATFAPADFRLDVTLAGSGSGAVTSDPAGIECASSGAAGVDCSESFSSGSLVSLQATPDAGSLFSHWTGDCSGSDTAVQVTLDDDRACTATFEVQPGPSSLKINLAGSGSGSVWSIDASIDCGDDCEDLDVSNGTEVTLFAFPAFGSTFTGWTGDCSGTSIELDIVVSGEMVCTAIFTEVLFQDDFEWGDTCDWSSAVGGECEFGRRETTVAGEPSRKDAWAELTGRQPLLEATRND